MPDDGGASYVPWVYAGVDRTTQHRLRLPKEFVENLSGLDDGSPVGVEGASLRPLKGFFSSREFALITRLVICPFTAGSRLSALLLLIDSEDAPLREGLDLAPIEAAGPTIAAKIDGARAILGTGTGGRHGGALRSRLSALLGDGEAGKLHVIVARVDLDRLAHELINDVTTADLYRFKRDLAGALTTMVSGSGELVSLGDRHALLIIQSRTPYSVRLLAHQFSEGMRSLVADSPPLDDPVEQTWRYPDGGKSIDEVVDAILEQ